MLAITENEGDIRYIKILPTPAENTRNTSSATENIGEGLHFKTSRNLKIDTFEAPDNKN